MIFGNRTNRFRYGRRVSSSRFISCAANFFSPASWKREGLTRHRFGGGSESNLPHSPSLSLSLSLYSLIFSPFTSALLPQPGRAAATCGLSTIPGVGFSDFHGGSRGAIPPISRSAVMCLPCLRLIRVLGAAGPTIRASPLPSRSRLLLQDEFSPRCSPAFLA